jgi:hypothetical protein
MVNEMKYLTFVGSASEVSVARQPPHTFNEYVTFRFFNISVPALLTLASVNPHTVSQYNLFNKQSTSGSLLQSNSNSNINDDQAIVFYTSMVMHPLAQYLYFTLIQLLIFPHEQLTYYHLLKIFPRFLKTMLFMGVFSITSEHAESVHNQRN